MADLDVARSWHSKVFAHRSDVVLFSLGEIAPMFTTDTYSRKRSAWDGGILSFVLTYWVAYVYIYIYHLDSLFWCDVLNQKIMYQTFECWARSDRDAKKKPTETQWSQCVKGDSSASEDLPRCMASIYTDAGVICVSKGLGCNSLCEPRSSKGETRGVFHLNTVTDGTSSGYIYICLGEVVLYSSNSNFTTYCAWNYVVW